MALLKIDSSSSHKVVQSNTRRLLTELQYCSQTFSLFMWVENCGLFCKP